MPQLRIARGAMRHAATVLGQCSDIGRIGTHRVDEQRTQGQHATPFEQRDGGPRARLHVEWRHGKLALNGVAFVEALQAKPEWRSLPVVVITAKDLTDSERQRLNGFVEKILTKHPHHREELLLEIHHLLAAHIQQRSSPAPPSQGQPPQSQIKEIVASQPVPR